MTTRQQSRIRLAFGIDDFPWDEERVLDRYELLYEAGLLEESVADGRYATTGLVRPLGGQMQYDHRRIAATAIARLRAKIKYRPVIFELMPPEFTLTELQTTVEAIAGRLRERGTMPALDDAEARGLALQAQAMEESSEERRLLQTQLSLISRQLVALRDAAARLAAQEG